MKQEILQLLKENLHDLERDCSGGGYRRIPQFQLSPRDFVSFAEKDLKEEEISTYQLVNATSNLKRAVDCQLDMLMSFLNLDDLYRKKRLGVDRKLGFFKTAGVFSARSLEKLNKFRNRLEHHYEIPDVKEVDVYFDVVAAFVTIGENLISNLMSASEVNLYGEDGGLFSVLDLAEPNISLTLKGKGFSANLNKSINPSLEDINDFALLFRLHILLIHYFNGALSEDALISEMEKEN